MPDHQQPTIEELDKGIKEAIEASETPETPEETVETPVEEKTQPETTDEEVVETEEAEEQPTDEETVEDKTPDYKEKFTHSSREAQILAAKNKQLNKAIEEAANIADVTDDEVKKDYPDWDLMSDTEKRFAKKSYISDKRFELIHQSAQEGKDLEQWNEKVDTFVADPKVLVDNPLLEGKQDEFKLFATKPSRRGVDFETLISSFLWEESKAKVKHTGKMFETGSGGPNEKIKPKSNKISIEESIVLRDTNYDKYKEYLEAGRIEENIV